MPKPEVDWRPIAELRKNPIRHVWVGDWESDEVLRMQTPDVQPTGWTHFAESASPAPPSRPPSRVDVKLTWVPVELEPVPWTYPDVVVLYSGRCSRHYSWARDVPEEERELVSRWARIPGPSEGPTNHARVVGPESEEK